MIGRLRFSALALLLALAACGGDASDAPEPPAPAPLLYTIASPDGAIEGWLFGTIHALPAGVAWRTAAIDEAVAKADLLVVEIAALDDQAAIAHTFAALATTPGQAEIGSRIDPALRPQLLALIEQVGHDPADFAATETWAAALMLAQSEDSGSARNGADRALLADFANRPIRELEGAARQLGIFDRLPQSDQRDLLAGVIEEARMRAADPDRLRRAWLAGDEAAIIEATTQGILADPELRQALLVDRNRAWNARILPLLKDAPQPLVAVGAAHLVGPDGLVELLRQAGYRVERVR